MSRHRASSMINIYGLNYCADHTNGNIYEYSLDIYSDNGDPIIKERDTAVIHGGLFGVPGKKLFFDEVEFIIVAGSTAVEGTGLGPQPVLGASGLCGDISSLTTGQLLSPTPLSLVGQEGAVITQSTPLAAGVSFDNSTVFSFTCALCRESAPDAGIKVHAMEINNSVDSDSNFAFYMDSNGYMNVTARNSTQTEILNVQISNNGASFADSSLYFFAMVIDLTDTSRREIYLNGTNISENGNYVSWNTYTNDTIQFADTGATPNALTYYIGRGTYIWGATDADTNSQGPSAGIDALGFITFDSACSLIPSAIWDTQGWVTDPQSWSGWYLEQPEVFFAESFWKNSGTTTPATYEASEMEQGWENYLGEDYYDHGGTPNPSPIAAAVINAGIGATVTAIHDTGGSGSLPSPPTTTPVELVSPYWTSTGDFIDLTDFTSTTFAALFGVSIEGADFNDAFATEKSILVNTSDAGNRLRVEDSIDCDNAALFVCQADGTIVDSMVYTGTATGDSVLVPTGANYYLVLASDTGTAQVRKWDSDVVDTSGAVSWTTFFGVPLSTGRVTYDVEKVIPTAGQPIWFTVPATSAAYKLSFTTIETTGAPDTTRTGSVNQTVGDYTSAPTYTWGIGGGIDCGINLAGQDISLTPGETYIFNVRNDSPTPTNWIRVQASLVAS